MPQFNVGFTPIFQPCQKMLAKNRFCHPKKWVSPSLVHKSGTSGHVTPPKIPKIRIPTKFPAIWCQLQPGNTRVHPAPTVWKIPKNAIFCTFSATITSLLRHSHALSPPTLCQSPTPIDPKNSLILCFLIPSTVFKKLQNRAKFRAPKIMFFGVFRYTPHPHRTQPCVPRCFFFSANLWKRSHLIILPPSRVISKKPFQNFLLWI